MQLAQRSTQGGRPVYTIRIPLTSLDVILPLPDPDQPDPDNRKVDSRHAKLFGDYIHLNESWVAPTLLARDNGGCTFAEIPNTDGRIGYLTIPWAVGALSPLSNIDGQHRILGVHMIIRTLGDEIKKIDREISKTTKPEKVAELTASRERLAGHLKRLENESVGVDIYLEPNNVQARQMFVDVADNGPPYCRVASGDCSRSRVRSSWIRRSCSSTSRRSGSSRATSTRCSKSSPICESHLPLPVTIDFTSSARLCGAPRS